MQLTEQGSVVEIDEAKFGKRKYNCREELDHVYKLVYSSNTEEQRRGYERILVWKARCSSLPASVECTLELLHVMLRDNELWPHIVQCNMPPYVEQQLQIMYSTSIMRFLNHLSSLFQDIHSETLFRVADRLNIPAWLVDIRHQSAHSNTLPPLRLSIRTESDQVLIPQEHTWKELALHLRDYERQESGKPADPVSEDLHELLESWQAVALYQKAGYVCLGDVSDKQLRNYVKRLKSCPSDDFNTLAVIDGSDSDCCIVSEHQSETDKLSLQTTKTLLVRHMRHCFKIISAPVIAEVLVNQELFLSPPSSLLKQGVNDLSDLPPEVLHLWNRVLTALPGSLFPFLLEQLILESNNLNKSVCYRNMAALWTRHLCLAVLKVQHVLDLIDNSDTDSLERVKLSNTVSMRVDRTVAKQSPKGILQQLLSKVENDLPQFKNVISLSLDISLSRASVAELVKLAILRPSATSLIFINSLLDLMDPPLPDLAHSNLLCLVTLYTSTILDTPEKYSATPLYMIDNLPCIKDQLDSPDGPLKAMEKHVDNPDGPNKAMEKHVDNPDGQLNSIRSHLDIPNEHNQCMGFDISSNSDHHVIWTPCQVVHEWALCPLGVLPCQQEIKFVNLDLPINTKWSPIGGAYTRESLEHVGVHHQPIQWSKVRQKRQNRIVTRALETIKHDTLQH
uniref:Ribosomal biogenesis protein LAS1L n=1 Tax=Timema monikensis TaxID=170555 RepID=A0A7R9EB23_9NEOP|nr:unnamed protein product [Timema monikensis]